MSKKTVGLLIGSLRSASYCKAIGDYISTLLKEEFNTLQFNIGSLPHYNQDLDVEGMIPTPWTDFREEIKKTDALLIITPEYNRSMPGVLKNALDIGSRPYGKNLWSGKPGAIISATPGAQGAFGANHHVRQVMVFLNVLMMQQPEAYLSGVGGQIDEKTGQITDERLQKILSGFCIAYIEWVKRLSA